MIATQTIRDIALRKLKQIGRDQHPVSQCYLVSDEFFSGIRYEAGPFCFVWNTDEEVAFLRRGEVLIETIHLGADSEGQRAA